MRSRALQAIDRLGSVSDTTMDSLADVAPPARAGFTVAALCCAHDPAIATVVTRHPLPPKIIMGRPTVSATPAAPRSASVA